MTKPKAVASAPRITRAALDVSPPQGGDGHDGGQNPVDPDLLGMDWLPVTDVAPVNVAQQDGAAGTDVGRRRGVNGRDGAHEHDTQHEGRQELFISVGTTWHC
jgi:hypothetical protein